MASKGKQKKLRQDSKNDANALHSHEMTNSNIPLSPTREMEEEIFSPKDASDESEGEDLINDDMLR